MGLWSRPIVCREKGTSLAIMLQDIVDNKLGTPEYIDHDPSKL